MFTIAAAFILAACADERYPANRVIKVADDGPRMNAAIEKARSTVNEFIAALQSPQPGQSGFTVKMAFSDRPNAEHMWLAPFSYDGKLFHGAVGNTATTVENVAMGQQAPMVPSAIWDWMYLEHGNVVGGRTLRVLRDTLSPSERADFDKQVQFRDQ
jgi:uncharacterized protein YegJ (DUF2314 family)